MLHHLSKRLPRNASFLIHGEFELSNHPPKKELA